MSVNKPSALLRRQTGHPGVASAISHDRLHTLEFSAEKVIQSAHTGAVTCMDLDHGEQRYLLVGAADASLAVYDTQQPSAEEAVAQQHEERSAAHSASAAHDPMAAPLRASRQASEAGAAAEHAALFSVSKQAPQGHRFSVSAVAWYPVDGGLFVSGGYDCEVKVWDANSLQVVCSFSLGARVHTAAMSAAAAAHCLVAVGSADTAVQLCDIVSGGFTHTLAGHRAAVWAVAWSPANEWQLATGGCDGQLRLWDIRRSGPLHIFDQHDTWQQRAAQRAQQRHPRQRQGRQGRAKERRAWLDEPTQQEAELLAAAREGKGEGPASERMFLPDRVTKYATAHAGSVTGVVPTPNGLHWLSAGTDDRVRLWDAASHRHELVHYPGAYNRATRARQLAVSDDGSVLFHPSGSAVQMFDVRSGALLRTLAGGHFDAVHCCTWNAAAQELYSGGGDGNIVVWAPARERVTAEREAWQRDSDGDDWSD